MTLVIDEEEKENKAAWSESMQYFSNRIESPDQQNKTKTPQFCLGAENTDCDKLNRPD